MGSFSVMPLQEVVDLLARRRVTGSLTCERGAMRKTCHVVEGTAVEAASNDPREYLGQLLINFGHLGDEDLARAFEAQQQTKVRLGQVLVGSGLVSADVVRDTLAIKVRETLLDAFLWDSGFFYVEEGPSRPGDDLDGRVDLGEVLREAEFRAGAWQAFRAAFSSGAIALEVDEGRAPAGLDPASLNGRILALARAGKTIDEIALALHATDFHLYQRLYALRTQGVLRAAPPREGQGEQVLEAAALLEGARELLAAGRPAEAEEAADRAAALDGGAGAAEVRARAREALARQLRALYLDAPLTPRLEIAREEVAELPLPAEDRWLLARCDGTRDARELVRLAPTPELQVLRSLKRLSDQLLVAFG
jgi:hypothetical protein